MGDHIGLLATRAAQQWPGEPFAHLGERTLTFEDLSSWIDLAAKRLVAEGVGTGDKVMVHLPNGFEVIVLQLAAWRIGAIAVPVVPIYRKREIAHIIGDVVPRVVVTTGGAADNRPWAQIDDILETSDQREVLRWVVGPEVPGWDRAPSQTDSGTTASLPEPPDEDECCLVLYTSGTTSAPKGVRLSSEALTAALGAWTGIGVDRSDVALAIAPLAHIAGLIPGALLPLTVGCPTVIMPKWEPAQAVSLIDRYRATISAGAAVFLHDLVDQYAKCPPSVHRLCHFVSGGAATPPELVRRAESVGMRASRAFGMTETAGVIAIAAADEPLERRACFDGRLVEDVSVRIVDMSGSDVGAGVEGDLRIAGPQVLIGYTDPTLTANQLRDGWFDPGDIGKVTADRWLQITGRTKDIINRGGEKFSTRDIEEALLEHPSVGWVAVTGIPDPRFGEAVAAFLVLAEGQHWEGPDALVSFLIDSGIAKAKIPVEWNIVDHIPVTATGKVQKHLLETLRTPRGST
jgi:acyl-CoA synthetase (AMP-forming)/AMP-acid ligase II